MPRIELGQWIADFVDFLTAHGGPFFHAVSWLLDGPIRGIDWLLMLLPAVVMGILAALIAWYLRGRWFALFTLLAFWLIDSMAVWPEAMSTLSLVLVATGSALLIAIPTGILAARSELVATVVRPVLDFMQTLPAFVYLLPAIFFFGIGIVPGVVSTLIFAMPPGVRLTELGIRNVDPEVVEAAEAFGATPNQILFGVQLPLALPTIMAGVNQVIMLSLSMVVIAGLIGAGGLGAVVVRGMSRLDIALGFEGGIAIVVLAIFLDRTTEVLGRLANPMRTAE